MKQQRKRTTYYLAALIIALAGIFLDQITKYLSVVHLKGKEAYVLWDQVFQLEYLENRGAAFGMLQNQQIFFFFSVILISAVVVWFYLRVPMEKKFLPLRLCAVFIMAGAYGNFIDRLRLGYVIDFFYFKLIDFPVFNVADIYVTVSTIVFCLLLFFYYKEEDLERIVRSRK